MEKKSKRIHFRSWRSKDVDASLNFGVEIKIWRVVPIHETKAVPFQVDLRVVFWTWFFKVTVVV